jgi:hypothetical protein
LPGHPPLRAVVIGSAPSSSSRANTSRACSPVAGRSPVQHDVEQPGASVTPCRWWGTSPEEVGDLVRGRPGGIVEAAALDLAHGQGPEPVDTASRARPSARAASARAREPAAVTTSVGRTDRSSGVRRAVRRARDTSHGQADGEQQ